MGRDPSIECDVCGCSYGGMLTEDADGDCPCCRGGNVDCGDRDIKPPTVTDDLLARIEAALAAATPGPWEVHPNPRFWICMPAEDEGGVPDPRRDANAALVALLRNHAAELVERVRRAEADADRVTRDVFDLVWFTVDRQAFPDLPAPVVTAVWEPVDVVRHLGKAHETMKADRDQWKAWAEEVEALYRCHMDDDMKLAAERDAAIKRAEDIAAGAHVRKGEP